MDINNIYENTLEDNSFSYGYKIANMIYYSNDNNKYIFHIDDGMYDIDVIISVLSYYGYEYSVDDNNLTVSNVNSTINYCSESGYDAKNCKFSLNEHFTARYKYVEYGFKLPDNIHDFYGTGFPTFC